MAKITTITNPLTGQPAQVDQLDHTAQQIDDGLNIARNVSNPNLLDNWYFGNPVNQRGQTSYTGVGYGIDRWWMTGDGNPNLILGDNYITYNGVGNNNLAQDVEGKFAGKTLTLSFLLKDPVNCMIAIRKPDWNVFPGFALRGDSGLYSVTATIPNDYTEDRIILTLCAGASGESVAHSAGIFASKLELGSQQTLAHQDENGNWVPNEIPNYGEQLARCQRHCIEIVPAVSNDYGTIGSGSAVFPDRVYVCVPLPVTMRAQPTVSYTGNWKLVSGVAAADGFDVNWMAVDKISNNSVTLNVTTANQVLTVGKTYHLWRVPASKNSMLFSADL